MFLTERLFKYVKIVHNYTIYAAASHAKGCHARYQGYQPLEFGHLIDKP